MCRGSDIKLTYFVVIISTSKTIQESKMGHDPSEDAATSMELVLLKLEKGEWLMM